MLMGNYYNTLTVEVRKGDCVWRGRYWKSCNGYEATSPSGERTLLNPTTGMISDLEMQQLKAEARSVQVTNLWGQQWTIRAEHLDRLETGWYWLSLAEGSGSRVWKWLKAN
jgi:hypothetical protein